VFSSSLSHAVQGGWFEPGAARPQVEVLPLRQAHPSHHVRNKEPNCAIKPPMAAI
jgi:hypothetical protein